MSEKKAKMLPNDLEAEQSLLGCLFISQDACADIFPMLMAVDFYSIAHQKIYQAMLDNYKKDVAVDYVTVSNEESAIAKVISDIEQGILKI